MADIAYDNARKCLPLLMANQSGWLVLNSHRFVVVWSGGNEPSDLHILYHPTRPAEPLVRSVLGCGIVSVQIPYIFRTPPGYNLLVRGPSNWVKDGAAPLEALVETDWCEASFLMSWKLTRPKLAVVFDVGEPICMIVPQARGELERFAPAVRPIDASPDLQRGFAMWAKSRYDFNVWKAQTGTEDAQRSSQKHYVRGVTVTGKQAPEHQTRRQLRAFRRGES
jgi:hypothetical protein